VTQLRNNGSASGPTRRIVFVAGPGTEILDLVGPLQVFARAADMFQLAQHPPTQANLAGHATVARRLGPFSA